MQNTVIGVFDNHSQAQAAVNDLVANGFSSSNVKLTPEQESHEARTGALAKRDGDQDEGWSISKFFHSLFGGDESGSGHSDQYHEAVRRGSYLVTVQADSDQERDQASDILNRYDPVDIDERSSQWRAQGWSAYDHGSPAYSDEEVQRERSTYTTGSRTPAGAGSTAMGTAPVGAASTTGAAPMSATSAKGATPMSTGASTNSGATAMGQDMRGGSLEGEARLPIVEEELRVGKRTVMRGGVRIISTVREVPAEETIRLRDEKVNVERHPVDKPASEADLAAFKEGSMELREMSEEPVVSKSARVVEEVVVNKDVRERDEKVEDTVRRTDVDVQQLAPEGGRTAGTMGGTTSDTGRVMAGGTTSGMKGDATRDTAGGTMSGMTGGTTSGMTGGTTSGMTGGATSGMTGGTASGIASGAAGGMGSGAAGGTSGLSDDFRDHWQTSYASQGGRYEDHEPAYRFGSELRGNQAHAGRQWNEIEPEARRDWESRNSGSPWERAKEAVRHGWEKTTGR